MNLQVDDLMLAGDNGDNQNEWEPDKSGADLWVKLVGLKINHASKTSNIPNFTQIIEIRNSWY